MVIVAAMVTMVAWIAWRAAQAGRQATIRPVVRQTYRVERAGARRAGEREWRGVA
jgi:hypothetical protein